MSFPFLVLRIHFPVVFFLFLVFFPRATFPQGVFGAFIPIGLRPSQPPCGWSTGFMALPLTVGLLPIHLDLPALPIVTWL